MHVLICVAWAALAEACLEDPDDGMAMQVASLPPSITSRFGEIVFAQGGAGYGWWPSLIYDPRLTVEPARSQARKYLGSRHLVYFFQCAAFPFSVLPEKQIKSWLEGLSEDLHLGRAAKAHGKGRYTAFREAFQVACLEMDKPADDRLDWEHCDPSSTSPSATGTAAAALPLPSSASLSATHMASPPTPHRPMSKPLAGRKRSLVEPEVATSKRARLSPDHTTSSKRMQRSNTRLTGEWFRHELGNSKPSSKHGSPKAWTLCQKVK
jgi:PWWP domain